MISVAIVGGKRIPFVKSQTFYQGIGNQEMLTAVINGLAESYRLKGELLGDVVGGAVVKKASDWNLIREAVLGSVLHPETPGLTIQRACGTSLEAANIVALKIKAGQINCGLALGSDTHSEGAQPMIVKEPRTGLSMGEHCEKMVKEWKISRREQDEWAYSSHQKAARAYQEGFYEDHLIPFAGQARDTLVRPDTSLEKLATLKTVFDSSPLGTLTAGNSTALTDGAAGVLFASESWAHAHGLKPLAYFRDAEVAALDFVQGAGLLMAPTLAVSRLLRRNHLRLQDFDFYEIHEAFAGQVLCTLKAWCDPHYCQKILSSSVLGEIDGHKVNVKGGSLALGHPFAATGARLLWHAAKLLQQKGSGRALVTACTAGGMGVAAILEL